MTTASTWLKFRLGDEEKELVARHANDTGHANLAEYLRALVSADLRGHGHQELADRSVGAPIGNQNRRRKKKKGNK